MLALLQWPVVIPVVVFWLLTKLVRWYVNGFITGEHEAYFYWGVGHGMLCFICFIPLAASIWLAGALMATRSSDMVAGIAYVGAFFISLGVWLWLYHRADLANDALIEVRRSGRLVATRGTPNG